LLARLTEDDMISWAQIAYGAALSGIVAAILLALVVRTRRWSVAVGGAAATIAGAVAWNSILHAAHGEQFFTDAPVVVLPASWQDTGSGVFALALSSVVLGGLVLPGQPARRVVGCAVLCGLAAFLVDVYLY
jgi:hypothetical protein